MQNFPLEEHLSNHYLYLILQSHRFSSVTVCKFFINAGPHQLHAYTIGKCKTIVQLLRIRS